MPQHRPLHSGQFCASLVAVFLLAMPAIAFDAQGHRGARGLWPENTLPAFKAAMGIGVTTLELDVVLTADAIPVISHDPRLRAHLTRDSEGNWVADKTVSIAALPYRQLQQYDVGRLQPGSRYAGRFKNQQPVDGTVMPRLADLFALVKKSNASHILFNIETKLTPLAEDDPEKVTLFVTRILQVVNDYDMASRVSIQSFDWRSLQIVQMLNANIPTVYLTADQSWLSNLQPGKPGPSAWTAGFDIDSVDGDTAKLVKKAGGAVWSPYHKELSEQAIAGAHALGLKVIPWTINDVDRMEQLIGWKVDGLITDYPDRLYTLLGRLKLPQPPQVIFED